MAAAQVQLAEQVVVALAALPTFNTIGVIFLTLHIVHRLAREPAMAVMVAMEATLLQAVIPSVVPTVRRYVLQTLPSIVTMEVGILAKTGKQGSADLVVSQTLLQRALTPVLVGKQVPVVMVNLAAQAVAAAAVVAAVYASQFLCHNGLIRTQV